MANPDHQIRLAGSGFDQPPPPANRVPAGGLYQPDRLAGEFPPDPNIDDADTPLDDEAVDVRLVARRLVIAFIAIAAIAIINFTVLRRFSADLPPVVLLGSFAIIAGATVLSLVDRSRPLSSEIDDTDPRDDGCAVGMCSGPRPIGELSRRAAARREQNRLSGRR